MLRERACWRLLEDHTKVTSRAAVGGAEKVAGGVDNEAGKRSISIGDVEIYERVDCGCASGDSKTVPSLLVPPLFGCAIEVSGAPSKTQKLDTGVAPFVPLNVATVLSVFVPAATLKTVPSLLAPPPLVVPKRLPAASEVRSPTGDAPRRFR